MNIFVATFATVLLLPCQAKLTEAKSQAQAQSYIDNETLPERHLEEQETFSPCSSGIFNTDRFKHFTISEPNGQGFLSHIQEKSIIKGEIDMNFVFSDDGTEARSHWRFETTEDNPTDPDGNPFFFLRNRHTGVSIASVTGAAESDDNVPQVSVQCLSSGNTVRIGIQNLIKGANEALEVYVEDSEVHETKCVPSRNSCVGVSGFGDSFRTISKRRSNCFFTRRRLKCAKSLTKEVETWVLEEVKDFKRLSGPFLVPEEVVSDKPPLLSGETIIKSVVPFAKIFFKFGTCPICSAIFASGVTLGLGVFGGGGGTSSLQQLREEMLTVTADMISSAVASNSFIDLTNALADQRDFFYLDYPKSKKNNFARGIDFVASLAVQLETKADIYDTDIARFFGGLTGEPNAVNIKKAFLGFDTLTFSIMESLGVRTEVYLLKALSIPDSTCAELADELNLQFEADTFITLLEATQSLLIHHRVENECCRANSKRFTLDGAVGFRTVLQDGSDLVIEDTHMSSVDREQAVEDIRIERELDIRHLSFPIQDFLDYFVSYKDTALQACLDIRSDPLARTQFENDAIEVELTCAAEATECVFDSDCCSAACEEGSCVPST